jgi:hypothetical protein
VFSSEQTPARISGLMSMMTAAQLLDARMLIPGAFELNAPPHRAARPARLVPAASFQEAGATPATVATSHVVAAPARPTTRLGYAAAIVSDLALITGIIFGVALIPALAIWGVGAAAAFILETLGRH